MFLCSQDLGTSWKKDPGLPPVLAESYCKIGTICCTSGFASPAVPSSLNTSGQGEVVRQLLGTATFELTRRCFSLGRSKFFQILKIPSFSLLGVMAATSCAPKVLELGLNQHNIFQVLVGMGGCPLLDQGTLQITDSWNQWDWERPLISWSPIYDQPPHFQWELSTDCQVLSKALPFPAPFFLEKPEEICPLDKLIWCYHLGF